MSSETTKTDIKALTKAMAKTVINHNISTTLHKNTTMTDREAPSPSIKNGEHIHIPPGTSLDDELLLLAGANLNNFNTPAPKVHETTAQSGFVSRRFTSHLFTHLLEYECQALDTANLPGDADELNEMGQGISDVMWRMHQAGVEKVVFSPRHHPLYPCWVKDHRVNELILGAFGKMEGGCEEGDQMDLS